ncbi:MAG TPA: NAD(P)-dependent oxidoreductase [Candidatus Sulfotelmatobacter sp.]|nr:NAD(P)-dependent oxidoreductase [Candidatus Sulfotelmatobacter sp.]
MRILITGGSGFIGRNLAEQLASTFQVMAPSSAELDLLNEQAVRDYLGAHSFDVIVHAATTRSNRRVAAPPDLFDRNCRMFFNLVRNQGRFGKMIHFGSGAEYDRVQLPARVREDYFDTRVPKDTYGFSKYICAKYIERSDQIVNLRLFGVFGAYEDYTVRFISNACCRALKGLPIVLRQDIVFDYLYIKDLVKLTTWFLENDARYKVYNVCTGRPVALTELARVIARVSGRNPNMSVVNEGIGPEYSADNSRMLTEMGGYQFWDLEAAIRDLYAWYERHEGIDVESLRFDEQNEIGVSQ